MDRVLRGCVARKKKIQLKVGMALVIKVRRPRDSRNSKESNDKEMGLLNHAAYL